MLSESQLNHLASLLDVSSVVGMAQDEAIYILAKRIAALELEVKLMKEQQNV